MFLNKVLEGTPVITSMTTIIISVSTVSIIVRLVNFERIASGLKLESVLLVPMSFPPTQCILPMVV